MSSVCCHFPKAHLDPKQASVITLISQGSQKYLIISQQLLKTIPNPKLCGLVTASISIISIASLDEKKYFTMPFSFSSKFSFFFFFNGGHSYKYPSIMNFPVAFAQSLRTFHSNQLGLSVLKTCSGNVKGLYRSSTKGPSQSQQKWHMRLLITIQCAQP